ncbi:phosphatase PAP2 family protein [Nocardioides cynanchi]|uniref:phosphatase PAP2 family protein n=1 Tax=Nocardioides cynanchi TaxID=2558918 RepID=UPI001246A0E9|nr:phosphatase PAP2 family protein [Nocardioides cynanchi]
MSVRSSLPAIARGTLLGRRGVREIALIGGLYIFYCVTRTFAEDSLGPAQDRAGDLFHLERVLHLDWEHSINNWFVQHPWAAVPACYWYAAAHYVVTLTVLVWLFRKGAAHYSPARWVLVVSCVIALACYLLLPTAPPRLVSGGYVDVLSLHSDVGWWSTDASAPKGMGQLTNELAAFPSLHAGWALWVALVIRRNSQNPWLRGLGWLHAFVTAAVVVGTGNHWILDVFVGWALVIVAMWLVDPWFADQRERVAVRVAFNPRLATGPTDPVVGPVIGPVAARDPEQARRPREST